jgi:hypothetical protein
LLQVVVVVEQTGAVEQVLVVCKQHLRLLPLLHMVFLSEVEAALTAVKVATLHSME